MESLIFDTTFLIDFQRERRSTPTSTGPAHRFLEHHGEAPACLSIVAYGEYAEGFEDVSHPAFLSVVESFDVLPITRPIAEIYARIARGLRVQGQLIGTNDLWIASTALHHQMVLVTRNLLHFSRVPDLRLVGYV